MIKEYIQKNESKFLEELFTFLRIPSVSTNSENAGDVKRAAAFVENALKAAGADTTQIFETPGHPIVYGEKRVGDGLPTVLVYGHYDVQPPDPLDLWTSPPFEPVVKDGKIYARGSSDDKGQMYMHIKALEVMQQTGQLSCNIKFMFEGEEEVGSENLAPFLEAHKDLLKADVVLISDTGILSNENPSITVGLRGLCYMMVEVTGPNRDLHSGMYGGAVKNPLIALSEIIAGLIDKEGRITVPGFYDKVDELSSDERAEMARAPFSDQEFMDSLGLTELFGEKGYSTLERKSIRPTLDVNGMWGGYTGEGAKTVIASKAHAKISMRLVPNQDPDEIAELFSKHFNALAPKGVTVKVWPHHHGKAAVTPTDSIAYKAAHEAFKEAWGKEPIPMREGGSIPIVALFETVLGLKTVLLGFGLDSDAIHSPNEHYGIFNYLKGIETIALFHKHMAKLS